jgi:hypothetical protein
MSTKKALWKMIGILVRELGRRESPPRVVMPPDVVYVDLLARCHGCEKLRHVHPHDLLCRWCFAAKSAITESLKPKP